MGETNPLILKLEQSGVLTTEDRPALAALCTGPRVVAPETILVRQGEKPIGLHLVMSGFAYRYKLMPDGRRQITGLLLPGDFCDLQGVALRKSDHFFATLTECGIVQIPQPAVDALTFSPSRIARAFWWATLVDESILRAWLANMGQLPAEKSLTHLFCELLLRLQVVACAETHACAFPITQDKLGDILGISSVHVNRVLRDLRERNLLTIRAGRAETPDVERLRAFCAFQPDYLHLLAER